MKMDYIGELSLFGEVVCDNDGEKYHIKITASGSGIITKLTNNNRIDGIFFFGNAIVRRVK